MNLENKGKRNVREREREREFRNLHYIRKKML